MNRMPCRMCSYGFSRSQNHTQLVSSPCKRCCNFWMSYGWKPPWCKTLCTCFTNTPVILKILCILVLGLHCTAARKSTPCHCCSLMGRNQSPSKLCECTQIFPDVEFCEVDIAGGISPQQPYHFQCRNHIWNTCVFICKCVTHFDYDHISLGSVQVTHSSSSSLQLCSTQQQCQINLQFTGHFLFQMACRTCSWSLDNMSQNFLYIINLYTGDKR
jgi:hypothetical protein